MVSSTLHVTEKHNGAGQHVKFNVDSGEDWQEIYS